MKCEEFRGRMPDVAAGLAQASGEDSKHLENCNSCAEQLKAMRATMALLDEWRTPEPSAYFDTRLQARLREEVAKPQAEWLRWFRRPVLAAALTVAMGVGMGLFFARNSGMYRHQNDVAVSAPPGTAVSDLQTLDKNHDLYADFDLLDDLELQQNVPSNP